MKTTDKTINAIISHVRRSDDPKTWGRYKFTGEKLVFRTLITRVIQAPNRSLSSDSTRRAQQVAENVKWAEKLLEKSRNGEVSIIDYRFNKDSFIESVSQDYSNRLKVQYLAENEIARKIHTPKGRITLGNSAMLDLIGRKVAYGTEKNNRSETEIQRLLATKVPMLPFPVFEQAQMDLSTLNILEQGGAETVKRKQMRYSAKEKKRVEYLQEVHLQEVHFTGASLFSIASSVDGTRTVYLFDLDRNEIKHGIFNPFLVKMPHDVASIKEAYEALKPDEVKKALKKGLNVRRQGEWFFIPLPKSKQNVKPDMEPGWGDNRGKKVVTRIELRAGPNRPNYAQMGVAKKSLVKGIISHAGREHKDLRLDTWCKAVPNTAQESFTITGDID